MEKDWLFSGDDYICGFRSTGVLIGGGRILVQREADREEYALPGGHVKIGETAAEALIREFKEETGADVVCTRQIWTEECFWQWRGKSAHTLIFYYLIELCEDYYFPDISTPVQQKDNSGVVLGWMPIEELKSVKIYPSFLAEKVLNLTEGTEHFISRE